MRHYMYIRQPIRTKQEAIKRRKLDMDSLFKL